MRKKYPHLLSPMKVGNIIFRNRLFTSPTGLHSLQGGETYPTEALIDTFANKARGGAALVTLTGTRARPFVSDGAHVEFDIYSNYSRHYLARLINAVHFYGAKASMEIDGASTQPGYDVSAGIIGRDGKPSKEMTEDIMDEIADSYAFHASVMQNLGCDMVMLHFPYRSFAGAFFSPALNKRTDKYGGSVENRARFPIMICDRIKQKCGQDFLIELRMSGSEPGPDGLKIEDSIEIAKLLEGHIDLLHIHTGEYMTAQALSFLPPTPNLAAAEAIKKSGTNLPIVTIGGYQDLDVSEDIIATGKADFISMARGWIADPNLGIKAYEGRGEDVVPCIKCNRCHDSACREHRTYVCSVNPTIGIEHRLEKIVKPPAARKKVAVVGGGPSGIQAALTAARRNHDVTLYEKSEVLGGQLNHSDYVSFKYPLTKFKNYLIHQIKKSNVKVCLNMEAKAALLEKESFDVVIAALGAEPVVPDIPGIDGNNVMLATSVYGNEDNLPNKIAVIGGGQVGCETGLHLAMSGHQVTIIEMQDKLAPNASALYREGLIREMEANESLEYILKARCIGIADEVTYTDANGMNQVLEVGTIIIATGMKPKQDEAIALCETGNIFFMIGDCSDLGNVEGATHTAFSVSILL